MAASVKRQAVAYGGLLATPAAFMANVSSHATKPASSTVASKQQNRATTPAAKATSKNQDVNAFEQQVIIHSTLTGALYWPIIVSYKRACVVLQTVLSIDSKQCLADTLQLDSGLLADDQRYLYLGVLRVSVWARVG